MEPLTGLRPPAYAEGAGESEDRVRVFRRLDAFAVEAYHAARAAGPIDRDGLCADLRRVAARGGAALVAALAFEADCGEARRALLEARSRLLEGRYVVYLARRLGLIDLKRYRTLASRHEAVVREVDRLLERRDPRPGRPRPP